MLLMLQELLCKEALPDLMPGGLLHDIPLYVQNRHPQLPRLIQDCAQPPPHVDRVVAARSLAVLLANITSQYGIRTS
ncbi:hypothetical protein PR048_016073 [Dryococelus australis]|uniref:Uncharacterized protein n=1 Tax=Dryococelus australis TaxID=614101 RepID=A0ABQ9HIQ2_9NEOP|nr:hypothetical protein PR048_016073 [Dryococelus australis]